MYFLKKNQKTGIEFIGLQRDCILRHTVLIYYMLSGQNIVDYYSLLGSSDLELQLIICESGKTIV